MPENNVLVNEGVGDTIAINAFEYGGDGVRHQATILQIENEAQDDALNVSPVFPMPVASLDGMVEVVPTLSTSAYGAGDVLFVATEVANVARVAGQPVWIDALHVVDAADQKQGFYLYIFDRAVTFGTLNGAVSISDADAAFFMGMLGVYVANYQDLGGAAVATAEFPPIKVKPNGTSIYVAAVTHGTPTYAANSLRLKIGYTRS